MPPAKAATTGRVNSEERAPRSKDSHSCILYYCEFIHSQIHLHTQMCIANLIECLLLAETDCVTETSAAPRRQQRMSNGNWARKLRMRCRANPRTRSAKSFYYSALNCFLLLSFSLSVSDSDSTAVLLTASARASRIAFQFTWLIYLDWP